LVFRVPGEHDGATSVHACWRSGNDLAIGVDDLPVICYNDNIAGTLKVAKCNDSACNGGNETISIVDATAGSAGGFCSIGIGADSLPVIAYQFFVNNSERSLKVAKCNDLACNGGDETLTTVLDFSVTSIKLAIGSDGLPIISFYNAELTGSASLMTVHCGSPDCQ